MQSPSTLPPVWPEVLRARRAIVVVDVVESVRLMREHEADFIERWRRFVNLVRTQLLPSTAGRMVKSLGDGMLLEFERVPAAMNAARAVQRRIDDINVGAAPSARIALRVGGHVSEVVVDADDIYGAGVNLAARECYQHAVAQGWRALDGPAREEVLQLAVAVLSLGAPTGRAARAARAR